MLNRYGFVALVLAMSIIFSDYSEAAKRRVVVEDHTGAWCQFCPRGSQTLRDLLDEFGDYFIPIQIHNGDRMVNEYQQGLAQDIGLSGYPGGTVDRAYRGQGTSDMSWDPRTRERIAGYTPLDVDVEYSITGGMLEATVTVTADADYDEQFAVNLVVLEDGVTGDGQGWDQVNAFNNVQGHPYYQKGNPVKNYIHDNVAWKYVGGPWGDTEGVPMSMKAGETYQKTFTWALSEETRIQNPDNIWVIGIAQETNKGEFINSRMTGKEGVKETEAIVYDLEISDEQYIFNQAGNNVVKTFEITNLNDMELDVALTTENSVLPQGWTAAPASNNLTLTPNATTTIDVTLSDGTGSPGYASVVLDVEVLNNLSDNQFTVAKTGNFYTLNDNTKNGFLFGLSSDPSYQLDGFAQTPDYLNGIAVIPLTAEALAAFDFTGFETIFLEINDDNAQAFSTATFDPYRDELREMINAGVDVMITGALNFTYTLNSQFNGNASANAKDFLSNFLGLKVNTVVGLVQNNQLITPTINGMNDLEGLQATLNGNYQQRRTYDGAIDVIGAEAGTDATNLAYIPLTSNGQPVDPSESVVLIGVQKENARVAVSGFSFETMANQANRRAIAGATYDWLKGEAQAGSPLINVVNTLDFGVTAKNQFIREEIEIENKGDATLMFQKIDVINDANGQFLFDDTTYPVDGIEPGGSATIRITYAATVEGVSTATLEILSSDGNNDATVQLSGETEPSSVSDEIENVLSLEATPNTFETETTLDVKVFSPANTTINLVDVNGVAVQNIYTGTLTAPTALNVNASGLAAGKYFIIANVDGQIARVPVIVEK